MNLKDRHDIIVLTVDGQTVLIGEDQEYKSPMDFLLKRLKHFHSSLDDLCDDMEIMRDDFIEALNEFPNEEPQQMVMDAYNGKFGDELNDEDVFYERAAGK